MTHVSEVMGMRSIGPRPLQSKLLFIQVFIRSGDRPGGGGPSSWQLTSPPPVQVGEPHSWMVSWRERPRQPPLMGSHQCSADSPKPLHMKTPPQGASQLRSPYLTTPPQLAKPSCLHHSV